ncbi:muscarinic acetylcholine receptor M5b [Scyliorhinus canicula]|uniref:muscarinic acetylcholine receptor M5b n=1 Tax=Scyliorhinus canicula TaxID=7830 RepID=UPI0018F324C5|nr:muscarinic acetylcholine receptor M5b [Scyliorhinus canicula]XP_038641671.1 muscarinic acetylcholine receptor M5b [Scyliorhinus canicula]XP_038641676.1 muscarinic acetylcholine receptor M5b [Scyliorhinus canicula]
MGLDLLKNTSLNGNISDQGAGHRLVKVVSIATITAIVSFITIIGNILVIVSFKVNSQLKTVNNYYLLSLACADLIIGVFSMNLYTSYILIGYWSLGNLTCDLWLALDYVASNASVMNLLLISFDRYFSITRPLTYRAKRTPKRAGIMIGLAWLISFVLWAPAILCWQYLVGERTVHPSECQIQFLSEPIITFGTAIAAFYIPVSVMTILYCRIYKETERRTKDLAELQGTNLASENEVASSKKTFLKSCFGCEEHKLSSRVRGQISWSSSNRSTTVTLKSTHTPNVTDECLKSDKMASFVNHPTSENDEKLPRKSVCSASKGENENDVCTGENDTKMTLDEHHIINDYENQKYLVSPVKKQTRNDTKYVSYKCNTMAVRNGSFPSSPGSSNGCTEIKITPCSSADTESPFIKNLDQNLGIQITKRKRLVLIKEKKAAQTLSAILLAFIITWTPYNIMVLVSTFCSNCIPTSLWHLGYWLCYVNSTVNPMCYALCNKTFRKTFKMLLLFQWEGKKK